MKKLFIILITLTMFGCEKETISLKEPVGCMCKDGTAVEFSPEHYDGKLDTSECNVIRIGTKYTKYCTGYSVLQNSWKTERYDYTLGGFAYYIYDLEQIRNKEYRLPIKSIVQPKPKNSEVWVDPLPYKQCSRYIGNTTNRCKNTTNNCNGICESDHSTTSGSCNSVQCSGKTQQGVRCKNTTTNCSGRCYLHG